MADNKYNLTPDEQIRLVNGGSFFGTAAVPEKNIPSMQFLDGGTGMNFEQLFGDFLSREGKSGIGGDALRNVLDYFYTPELLPDEESKELYEWIYEKLKERTPDMTPPGCYPPGILLGATWNPEAVYEVGKALGIEARAFGVNVLLGTPNVNLHRDIRNGRLFEGYSEDPCLVSKLAPKMTTGLQEQSVAANVKHFAANNQETNRMNIDEHISERALHELYFPGFRACVKAGTATVMSAYNRINGIPCTENRAMLYDMLRGEWGFDGLVMSDWNAVYHPAEAVNAGNDLAMPGPIAPDTLAAALENGTLSAAALNESSERAADLAKKYALPATGILPEDETDKAAYNAAAEGIILLKNNGAAPLSPSDRISLYGEYSDMLLTCGGGSAGIHTTRNVSFVKALSERFEKVSQNALNDADAFVYVYSLHGREGVDRKEISVPLGVRQEWEQLVPKAESTSMKKILILNVSGPVSLDGWEERFDAVFCIFLPGMQGANALADCLCGAVNPSGRLPLTWPARIEDMPAYLNFPGDGMQVSYGEGIFVGYRWYDARRIEPLYPFGHGLSYTDFEITDLSADNESFSDSITVSAVVANTGNRAGKTVVQLYVSDVESTLTKPVRELKAFEKIHLEAGESKRITFRLAKSDFASYDPNLHEWTTEEGEYVISAGFSSRDLRRECTVYANVSSPYSYGAETSVLVIMENEELKSAVYKFFAEKKLPWSAMLTNYEYTAQYTLETVLSQAGCDDGGKTELYGILSGIRKK